ncbi:MAG: hypothetical protein F8N39_05810 [Clostridiaceae bacterium]|nr:hypothetical protein [Clostridiaceae bacterium]
MASSLHVSFTAANAQATALSALCNSGFIDIFSTAQPATPETAPGGTALATLQFGATAFGAPVNGVLTANAISGVTIVNSGTAVWFRVTKSDHTTPVFDGSCGTSAADMVINSVALSSGASLTVSSLTYTVPGV